MWRDDAYRITGGAPRVVRQLHAYLGAGVRGFIVQMPAPFDFVTLERFAEVRAGLVGDQAQM